MNASRKSSPASATSPRSSFPAPARSPISTRINCASPSDYDPTNCSRTTTDEPAPTQAPPATPHAQAKRPTPVVDIWRTPQPLPDVEPITIPDEVGALLRSLGDPPLIDGSVTASHYFTAVLERAAAVAAALASASTSSPTTKSSSSRRCDEQAAFHATTHAQISVQE